MAMTMTIIDTRVGLALAVMLTALLAAPAFADLPAPADANAICPVHGDRQALAAYHAEHEGETVYFCCARCRGQFERDPQRYLAALAGTSLAHLAHDVAGDERPRWLAWLGELHIPLVHLPLGLLAGAFFAELLRLVPGVPRVTLDHAVRYCLWLGGGAAVLAAALGWIHAAALTEDELLAAHRRLGSFAALAAVVAVGLHEWQRRGGSAWRRRAYYAGLVVMVGLIGAAGHFGGMLVHGRDFLLP